MLILGQKSCFLGSPSLKLHNWTDIADPNMLNMVKNLVMVHLQFWGPIKPKSRQASNNWDL